ncbi:MAG: hypothetical protein RL207_2236 [Bacteroidota bacterium]|jgi:hypothetical protein
MSMSENEILYALTVLLIVLMIAAFMYRKSIGIMNSVVFCLYAFPLYYSILFNGNGGSSFLWWFYLIVLISTQTLIVSIFLIYRMIKK